MSLTSLLALWPTMVCKEVKSKKDEDELYNRIIQAAQPF